MPDVPDVPAPTVADLVAAAVLGVPGVHALHGGTAGEVATYLPGRRVPGVRVRDDGCAVHVVLEWAAPIAETTDRVRAAARTHVDGPIDVAVEDVVEPAPPPHRSLR